MELENIVANTVYIKARTGELKCIVLFFYVFSNYCSISHRRRWEKQGTKQKMEANA